MPKHYPRFDKVCIIEGCGKPGYCRGWCGSHYDRWKHHGDPVGGATGHGEARRYFDEVVANHRGSACLIWPFSTTVRGYGTIRIGEKLFRVHRLMCEQEHGPAPSPKHEAAHSCGNGSKGCVSKQHVSWKTREGNAADRVLHGNSGRGEKNKQAKLTIENVEDIRRLRGIKTNREISAMFGISRGYVHHLQTGGKWAWLGKGNSAERRQRA
jgi:hypothetical protein